MERSNSGMAGDVSGVRPRLDEKPWGGRRLAWYGLDLPEGQVVGEALVTADDAEIVSGNGAGATLGRVIADSPTLLGDVAASAVRGRSIFPLLVKLIDARENLSIQVHPDDDQAAALDRLGKTEAWHVLAAESGASVYLGLREGVSIGEFREAAARLDGSSAELLRRMPARAGSTVLIPAGTVHALGAGVMVYEIQQPSDVTFRLDDWGRTDARGNPRKVHLDEGFAVLRQESRPEWIDPVDLAASEGRRHLLVACRRFALERIALPTGGRYELPKPSGPQVLTILEGIAAVGRERLDAGRSAVVWPRGHGVELLAETPVVALRGWVPDLGIDLPSLARLSSASRVDLERLAGSLPDARLALASS